MDVGLQKRLGKAIWRADIREVIGLLDAGADLEGPGENGFTPLMQAAEMEIHWRAGLHSSRGMRRIKHRGIGRWIMGRGKFRNC